MSDTPCRMCGQATEPFHDFPWGRLRRCMTCGLEFRHPLPTAEELQAIYGADYYDSWGGTEREEAVLRQKQATFAPHLQRLQTMGAKGRLLDVGCARGEFLDLARQAGFDVHGVEISPHGAMCAGQRLGVERITCGTLEGLPLQGAPFDVITLFDCIEHMRDPAEGIRAACQRLKPGGWLYLVTPDAGSLSHGLMGRQWWHFKAEHLYYFSRDNLGVMLESEGLQPVARGSNLKTLSPAYALTQLETYPVTGLTPLARWGARLLPEAWMRGHVTLPSGEFWMLAQK